MPEEQKRFYAVKLFERDDKIREMLGQAPDVSEIIARAEKDMDDDAESIITNERYQYIASVTDGCLSKAGKGKLTVSDKIDRIVTNRWLALPIFAVIMWAVYYISVSTVGTFVTDWTNDVLFGEIIPPAIEKVLVSVNCADWLKGLVLDGIVAGVWAPCWGSCRRCWYCSSSLRFWRHAVTWLELRLSWTVSSVNSDCRGNPSSRC